jgi:integrase
MIGCRPLTPEEIPAILAALETKPSGPRDRALFILGITTGFRVSELLSLKIRDLTTEGTLNSHVRIPKSRMKGKKRSRSAILAPLTRPFITSWLLELHDQGKDGANNWFFQSRKGGTPLSRIHAHRLLAAAYSTAGIHGAPGELGTHSMRKTFAARMWDAHDGNIWKVQNALGHASPASTVAYLSFNDEEQHDAVYTAFGDL